MTQTPSPGDRPAGSADTRAAPGSEPGAARAPHVPGANRPGRRWRRGGVFLAAALYSAASLTLLHGVLGGLRTRAPLAGTGDIGQMAWFMRWTATAIQHGQDPFVTTAMNAPRGVNLMWNTAMPLAGALMSPVTLHWGPLATVNVLFLVAPVATGLTARWWLSRHLRSELARLVGGALIGFGPYMATHLGGHLNLAFIPLVPVLLRFGEDVLFRRPGARGPAVALGVTAAAQALLSEEILLLTAVGLVALLVGVIIAEPTGARAHWSRMWSARRGVVVAAGVAGLLLVVPFAVQLLGPDRATGVNTVKYAARLRDLVVPDTRLLVGSASQDAALTLRGTSRFEDAVYLGVPVLLLVAAAAWRWWRRVDIRAVVIAMVAVVLLSLGSGRHGALWTGWQHPLGAFLAPPGLSSMVPERLGLVLDLLVGWLAGTVLDAAVAAWPARRAQRVPLAVVAVTFTAVIVSWLPAPPADQVTAAVPSFFTTAAVRSLPAGTLVDLLPAPDRAGDAALLDQAVAGLRFRMLGSYALSRNNAGRVASNASIDPVTALAAGPLTSTRVAAARCALSALGVREVLVVIGADHGGVLAAAAARAFGPGQVRAGVWEWPVAGCVPRPGH